jgi:hypothetical protein
MVALYFRRNGLSTGAAFPMKPDRRTDISSDGSDGRGAAALLAAGLTLAVVVCSYFFESALGQGGYLLMTVPFSPVLFGILYYMLRRSV